MNQNHSKIIREKLASFSLVLALLVFSACEESGGEVNEISALEAHGQVRNGFATLLDVRELDEIEDGGVADGAQWFPLSQMDSDEASWEAFRGELEKDQDLYIYCDAGEARAKAVAEELMDEGFQVSVFGFQEWKASDLPVTEEIPNQPGEESKSD